MVIARFLNHQRYFVMHSCTISKTTSLVTTFRVFTNQLASRTSPTRIFHSPPRVLQRMLLYQAQPTNDWQQRLVCCFLKHHTVSCMEGKRPSTAWVVFKSIWCHKYSLLFEGEKHTACFLCRQAGRFVQSNANYQFSCNLLKTKNKAHQIVGCTLSMYINSTKSHIPSQEFANCGQNDLPSEKCWNSTPPPSVQACSEPPRQGEMENFRNFESQESWEMPSIFTFDNNSTLFYLKVFGIKNHHLFFSTFVVLPAPTNQPTLVWKLWSFGSCGRVWLRYFSRKICLLNII